MDKKRSIIRKIHIHLLWLCFGLIFCSCEGQRDSGLSFQEQSNAIVSRIKRTKFPEKSFSILDFGAKPDTTFNSKKSINEAIEVCSQNGGGKVIVPKGKYLTGPIYLKSNVNLHLEEGAELFFSTDYNEYLPVVFTRWEGVELMNYSPLIRAYQESNIAITGKGTLNGQASRRKWWPWAGGKYKKSNDEPYQNSKGIGRNRLMYEHNSENFEPTDRVYGEGHYLRPNFIQFYDCDRILVEDVTIKNSPMWILHPVLSENIVFRGLTVDSHGPNSDGCDPESCRNVLIENCLFNTGDDCIAIKSGRNYDGRRVNVASENIIIRNNTMRNGHGGVVIGSEASGGVKNVFVENCIIDSPRQNHALRIKSNSQRGGVIENIFARNLKIGEVGKAVLRINLKYEPKEGDGDHLPKVRNVFLENITSKKSRYGLWLTGLEDSQIENIQVKDAILGNVLEGNDISNVQNISLNNVLVNGKKVSYGN